MSDCISLIDHCRDETDLINSMVGLTKNMISDALTHQLILRKLIYKKYTQVLDLILMSTRYVSYRTIRYSITRRYFDLFDLIIKHNIGMSKHIHIIGLFIRYTMIPIEIVDQFDIYAVFSKTKKNHHDVNSLVMCIHDESSYSRFISIIKRYRLDFYTNIDTSFTYILTNIFQLRFLRDIALDVGCNNRIDRYIIGSIMCVTWVYMFKNNKNNKPLQYDYEMFDRKLKHIFVFGDTITNMCMRSPYIAMYVFEKLIQLPVWFVRKSSFYGNIIVLYHCVLTILPAKKIQKVLECVNVLMLPDIIDYISRNKPNAIIHADHRILSNAIRLHNTIRYDPAYVDVQTIFRRHGVVLVMKN